ncbi:hypothetical protein J15TS10_37800 [Paenibacillus woosongensis]|uniref:Uncharacterized protein n=1 Tax=Paenibacillus woosongensis TaxID=307580 RepID=A0ABQ4MVP2_9BACL|nr:hypothetical protein J15TS10_37800 [Paenibacillus woosongensis]
MKPSNRFAKKCGMDTAAFGKCHGANSFKIAGVKERAVLVDEKALSLRKESPRNLQGSLFI